MRELLTAAFSNGTPLHAGQLASFWPAPNGGCWCSSPATALRMSTPLYRRRQGWNVAPQRLRGY